jgi:hypothetical protein
VVSRLILAMFLRLAEADWSTVGQMADAIASSFPQPHYIGQHVQHANGVFQLHVIPAMRPVAVGSLQTAR